MIKTNNALCWWSRACVQRIQYGGQPTYWKSKTCNNSATVQSIATKFCRITPIVTRNRAEDENLLISKIEDGGRPPYWKSKTCNNWATIQPIAIKLLRTRRYRNCAEGENLHILNIQEGGRPPCWKSKSCNNYGTFTRLRSNFAWTSRSSLQTGRQVKICWLDCCSTSIDTIILAVTVFEMFNVKF